MEDHMWGSFGKQPKFALALDQHAYRPFCGRGREYHKPDDPKRE